MGGVEDGARVHVAVLVDPHVAELGDGMAGVLGLPQALAEAFGALVAQCPGVLLVDGRVERREDVPQREAAVLVEGALRGPHGLVVHISRPSHKYSIRRRLNY